jgi:hypothetical protein
MHGGLQTVWIKREGYTLKIAETAYLVLILVAAFQH